jgi:hypothetical protein
MSFFEKSKRNRASADNSDLSARPDPTAGPGELEPAGVRRAPRRWFSRSPVLGGPFAGGDEGGSGDPVAKVGKCETPETRLQGRVKRLGFGRLRRARQYKDKWPGALADHREGSPRRGPAHGHQVRATLKEREGLRADAGQLQVSGSDDAGSVHAERRGSRRAGERAWCAP